GGFLRIGSTLPSTGCSNAILFRATWSFAPPTQRPRDQITNFGQQLKCRTDFRCSAIASCWRTKLGRNVSGSCRRKEFLLSALATFAERRSSRAAKQINRQK